MSPHWNTGFLETDRNPGFLEYLAENYCWCHAAEVHGGACPVENDTTQGTPVTAGISKFTFMSKLHSYRTLCL